MGLPDKPGSSDQAAALLDGGLMPATRGGFDGEWFTEEANGSARFAVKMDALLHEERSPWQKISVYDSSFFGRVLTLDDVFMLSERDEFVYHEMLVHVPLLAMPDPASVLIIGGGDGGCLREVLRHDCVQRVVLCELDERVSRVCEQYFSWPESAFADARAECVFEDGITFIKKHTAAFDLVIVDSTDPVGAAVGLFRREFYEAVRACLRSGGVMTAQTESPHWNADMLGAINREIRSAFGQVDSYLAMIPTYPGGCWSLAWASSTRRPGDFFDQQRAKEIAASCSYYQPGLQSAAFQLPVFAERACSGENLFERFDSRVYRNRNRDD
ncbi:MAG TPA: polyamine aminopropyltransferase [Deltaproteobacteria bacterium]|nr:polyamine aminopropyltransferase [Candidatus Binatota bacterium]HIL14046.1 polyamine aminopropyltransferase [Deltaproteobacteria bacterium]